MSLVSRTTNGKNLVLLLVSNTHIVVSTLSIHLIIVPWVLLLPIGHLIRWTWTPVIAVHEFSIVAGISRSLLKLSGWGLLTKPLTRISITWLFGFTERSNISYNLYLTILFTFTSAILTVIHSSRLAYSLFGLSKQSFSTGTAFLGILIGIRAKIIVTVHILRLLN